MTNELLIELQNNLQEFLARPISDGLINSIIQRTSRILYNYVDDNEGGLIKVNASPDKYSNEINIKPGNLFTACLMLYEYVPPFYIIEENNTFTYDDGTIVSLDPFTNEYICKINGN